MLANRLGCSIMKHQDVLHVIERHALWNNLSCHWSFYFFSRAERGAFLGLWLSNTFDFTVKIFKEIANITMMRAQLFWKKMSFSFITLDQVHLFIKWKDFYYHCSIVWHFSFRAYVHVCKGIYSRQKQKVNRQKCTRNIFTVYYSVLFGIRHGKGFSCLFFFPCLLWV